jgi:hypothetical protein
MLPVRAYINDNVITVSPEARMEEGLAHESIPVVSPSICDAESWHDDIAMASVVAPEHDSSIPVAIASELLTSPPLSSLQHQEDMKRPGLLSATVCKGPQDENGLLLANTNGSVTIAGFEQDGMFKVAPFEIGDRLMSVNSVSCEGMDADRVVNLIQNAENIVTVVVRAPNGRADLVSSMVRKNRPETLVGVTLTERGHNIVISKIAEDGLLAHTLLNVGDTCLSINGTKITPNMNARASAALILISPEFVTIKTKKERETGVVVAASKKSRAVMACAASRAHNCGTACIFFFSVITVIVIVTQVFSGKW